MYNSAVFSTIYTHPYDIFVVTPEFVSRADLGVIITRQEITDIHNSVISSLQDPSQNKWQNMTNKKCLEAYGTEFVSGRSDLLAITSNDTDLLRIDTPEAVFAEMASIDDFEQDTKDITINGLCIVYCLSKLEDEAC